MFCIFWYFRKTLFQDGVEVRRPWAVPTSKRLPKAVRDAIDSCSNHFKRICTLQRSKQPSFWCINGFPWFSSTNGEHWCIRKWKRNIIYNYRIYWYTVSLSSLAFGNAGWLQLLKCDAWSSGSVGYGEQQMSTLCTPHQAQNSREETYRDQTWKATDSPPRNQRWIFDVHVA